MTQIPLAIEHHSIKVLLIDDQMIIVESVRRMLSEEKDIEFFYCTDPKQALKKALEVQPTVILQDLVMPQIEGMTLVRYFRAHPQTKEIPLIVLSTKEEPTIKAQAFALGANDYLVKLPDPIELVARLRYHSQSYIHLLERNEAYQALMSELKEAADYVCSLLPLPMKQGPVQSSWVYIPSTQLGGDTFGYHWLDANRMVIYLLDVCGHGVGAALLSVSVMNVLRAQTLPHTNFADPANVLTELNAAFPMEKYNNMYFTIWYGVYDIQTHSITYCSGGHPPAVLVTGTSRENAQAIALKTDSFIIGGMPDTIFSNATRPLQEFSTLYVFSDGTYELTRPKQPMMSLDEFIRLLQKMTVQGEVGLESVLAYLRQQQAAESFEDDFSMIKFCFEQKT